MSVYSCISFSVRLSFSSPCLSVSLSTYMSLPLHLGICLSLSLSIYLSIYLSICLSIFVPVLLDFRTGGPPLHQKNETTPKIWKIMISVGLLCTASNSRPSLIAGVYIYITGGGSNLIHVYIRSEMQTNLVHNNL